MLGFLGLAGLAADAFGIASGRSAARDANRANRRLAQEQRDWEQMMANTAVQRRVNDIKAAGGNPAAAFVNGGEAATPSISPARMEPDTQPGWFNFTAKALAQAQVKNVQADTAHKLAEARSAAVEADIREQLRTQEQTTRYNRFVEQQEWDDLKTRILRNTDTSTAAEAKKLRETVDQMIAMAKQQTRKGQLDLEALENIAKVGGLELGKTQGILKLIIDLIRD